MSTQLHPIVCSHWFSENDMSFVKLILLWTMSGKYNREYLSWNSSGDMQNNTLKIKNLVILNCLMFCLKRTVWNKTTGIQCKFLSHSTYCIKRNRGYLTRISLNTTVPGYPQRSTKSNYKQLSVAVKMFA